MLKKLARYGNSNALVIDKAIMELLNIQEGAVVKLTTDGKSLTVTPIEETSSVEIQEDFTSQDAMLIAAAKNSVKEVEGKIPKKEQTSLENRVLKLYKEQHVRLQGLSKKT